MKKPWDNMPTLTMSSSFLDWEGIKVSTNPSKALPFIMARAKNIERRMRNAEMLLAHYSRGSCQDDVFGRQLSAHRAAAEREDAE